MYTLTHLSLGGATPPPISYYPGSGSGSSRIDPRVDSPSRNDPTIRTVNQADQRQTSPYYGKQDTSAPQQNSGFYSNRGASSQQNPPSSKSADQGYGKAPGGYISNPRSRNDSNQGYSQAPSNSPANPRSSTDFKQGYSQASSSLISSPQANKDTSHRYNQPSRSPVTKERTSGAFGDVD